MSKMKVTNAQLQAKAAYERQKFARKSNPAVSLGSSTLFLTEGDLVVAEQLMREKIKERNSISKIFNISIAGGITIFVMLLIFTLIGLL